MLRARPETVATYARLAAVRHLSDLREGSSRGLTWSPSHAAFGIRFFPTLLRHWKGEWADEPFVLAAWQAFVVGSLVGWYRRDDTRRFRVGYLEVPRKNGKSMLAAGLALLLTFFDGEAGAEGYCLATSRKQARIVFDNARRCVQRSAALARRLMVGQHAIAHLASGSRLEPISRDSPQQHGFNASLAVIDELHAHRTAELLDTVQSSMGARRHPLTIEITTAGMGRESICWAHHQYTAQLLEGVLPRDDAWFGVIWSADATDVWDRPATWRKANPNYGVSVRPSILHDQARVARQLLPARDTFRQMFLDLWAEQSQRWLDMAAWDACAAAVQAPGDRVVYGGLDLAATRDMTALCWIAEDGEGILDASWRFWIPEAALERRERTVQVAYRHWIDAGLLTVTPGPVVDYAAVRAAILEDATTFGVSEVGYDPWNAQQLAGELEAAGVAMRPVRPGFATLHDPTSALGERVATKRLRHGGHQVARWMAANLIVARDPDGRIKPDRKRSGDKIDGMYALILAVDRLNRAAQPLSDYADGHDVVVVDVDPGLEW
jgi:phage terminase large subunit-like protein